MWLANAAGVEPGKTFLHPNEWEGSSLSPVCAPPHLGLLLLCGVEDGGAADLGQLAALAVKGPAADLISDHVFDEKDAAVEAEGQPVEQLDVLQQVVIGVAVETKANWRGGVLHRLLHTVAWLITSLSQNDGFLAIFLK